MKGWRQRSIHEETKDDRSWRTICNWNIDLTTKKGPIKMKPKATITPHKLGANQKEAAVKTVKHDANFKQSRDVREDRGQHQMKNAGATRSQHGK
jgi:hypothetical protein